jgi:hypothetical protein
MGIGTAILGLIAVVIGWILGRAPGLAERLLQDLLPFLRRPEAEQQQQAGKPMGGAQGQGNAQAGGP